MRIGILGTLEVRDEAARPIEVRGRRLRTLLIRLAVDSGRSVPSERLIDDLWAETPPVGGVNALQALVSRLRGVGGREMIESGPGGYRLAVDPADIDAAEFGRLVTTGRTALAEGDAQRADALLRQALRLWRGPALAEVADAGFAIASIARLEKLRLDATEDRVEAEFALGRAARLVPELEELVAAHPLRERLRGQLMRALYAAGRQAEALEAYEAARKTLGETFGIDPGPELSDTHLAILRRSPELDAPARPSPIRAALIHREPLHHEPSGRAPVRTLSPRTRAGHRTNLPAQFTSFVGREAEIDRLGELLGRARLVTLTGPGGAGKTRLACEAATRLVPAMPDGVWFVPLAPVRDALDVPQAVLSALGIPDAIRVAETIEITRPLDRLVDVLENQRLTLVLDNCEHLVGAVAALADRLLAAAPEVRILATSREPLSITGETLCPVPSLPLPPEDADAERSMDHASVRLFADRAEAVRPGFVVDADNVAAVVGICRALDGIPLAIELAAARLRALTPAQVAGRLDDRFRLLTSGSRTALPRHQTLRAIVDWSWDLLDDAERTVLRRLSIFSGGAAPDAAERVCALDGDSHEVIDLIAALVDKSLVVATGQVEVRYRLLETVRAYALQRLAESGEQERVRAAHAAYFLGFAERAEPELRGREQVRWTDRLVAEHDNCIAALRGAIEVRDVPTGVRLVGALAWFWIMRDYEAEAGQWAIAVWALAGQKPPAGAEDAFVICGFLAALVTAMASDDGPRPEALQAAVELAVSHLSDTATHPVLVLFRPLAALFGGDVQGAQRELLAAADHPDQWARAAMHTFAAYLWMAEGDLATARTEITQGHAGFRALGDRWGMVLSLSGLAEAALARGDAAEAMRACQEAYGYATEGVSPDQGGALLILLGRARAVAGDTEGARADLELGARTAERIGEHSDAAYGLVWLSDLARRAGDLGRARPLLQRALAIIEPRARRIDLSQAAATTFSKLGCLCEQEGDLVAAAQWHERAMRAVADSAPLPVTPTLATVVEGLAAFAVAKGEPERAAELLGTTHMLRGYRDPWSLEIGRTTEAVTRALGPETFETAYARGRAVTRDQALALTVDGRAAEPG
ncbi:AfsR/SARP family transcriptional regulator [Actinomadura scrupuli]|uniref:AfsR/SARP family transcriptional regulator n=1 Tax=Actinomadura scrupuli TaxID=559629 RepID=UPI003D98D65C